MTQYVFPLPGFVGSILLHHGSDMGASDLFAPIGTPILNMVDGVVTYVGNDPLGGNNVSIHGADGLDYYYAHMRDTPLVREGQTVAAGAGLGVVGITGNAVGTPPHLHLGIGYGIANGDGPHGGAGNNFDAVSFLKKILAGAGAGLLPGSAPAPSGGQTVGAGGAYVPSGPSPLAFLADRAVMLRAVAVLVGIALVIVGLLYAAGSNDQVQGVVKTGIKAAAL